MSISDTILVTTVVRDTIPTVTDFSTPLLATYTPEFTGVQEFSVDSAGLIAMVDAGLAVTSQPYRVLTAIASQSPHCARLKVGARSAPSAQGMVLTPTQLGVGRTVHFDLTYGASTHAVTYTVATSDDAADVVTGLLASAGTIAGLTLGGTTTLTIALTTPAAERFYVRNVVGLSITDSSAASATLAEDLASILADDSDWFGLLIDSTSDDDIETAATFAAANKRIFGACSPDATNLATDTGVAHTLHLATVHNAFVLATRDTEGLGAEGLMGRQFSQPPGSSSWAHKQITGAIPDAYTGAEFSAARANFAMTYVQDEGWAHTYDGFACSGRYLDITRGILWIEAQIRAAMLQVFANCERVPYTDSGAAKFEAALSGVLARAEKAPYNILAPGWTITRPRVAEQSALDRAARKFPNLRWNSVLQGAVQSLTVAGEVVL